MVLRQAAFAKPGTFLKGNLHCHTTLSDGSTSPESTVRQYANAGYDFLAITDHQLYNFRNYAPDTGLLIIPAMEADRFLEADTGMPVVHVVAIGPEEGNGYTHGQPVHYQRGGKAIDCQDIIDDVLAANNLPILAHPMWSGNSPEETFALQGYGLMEVWNSASSIEWGVDENTYHWDYLLHKGRKVFGVASDDGHNMDVNCHGAVRVKAEKNADSILQALKNGEFYATCGPEIYDFYIEDGKICIQCSPVSQVIARNLTTPHRVVRGENMVGAQIPLRDLCKDYIRVEIVDAQGRRAWTNPIFLK